MVINGLAADHEIGRSGLSLFANVSFHVMLCKPVGPGDLIMKLLMSAALAAGLFVALPSVAFAESCYDLWYERNEIYYEHGYCFVTDLAIRTFGNDSCYTKNPRFSYSEQRRIQQIKNEEENRGCNVN